jgi:RNA polymerase sigma-70 factor, ECF subfamily
LIDFSALPDESLAKLVAEGQAKALETLYDRYSRQAIGLAYRILGQLELAEEVAQEAFLKFWEKPELYRTERGRFISWLLSTVHNRAINERRRSSFRLNVSADAEPATEEMPSLLGRLADDSPDPHELVWTQVQLRAVRNALNQLSLPQRKVIELAYFNGLNQREIAETLGEPLGTIKTRIRLSLQKLRSILQAEGFNSAELGMLAEAEAGKL